MTAREPHPHDQGGRQHALEVLGAVALALLVTACASSTSGSADGGFSGQDGGTPSGGQKGTGGSSATGGSSTGGRPAGGYGGSSAATGGSSATGGSTSTGGSSAGGGSSVPPCNARIEAVPPYSLTDIAPGKGARIELRAVVTAPSAGGKWSWVVFRDVATAVPESIATEALSDDNATVALPVEMAGRYTVMASYLPRLGCNASVSLNPGPPKPLALRALIAPPVASGIPAQEFAFTLADATPAAGALPARIGFDLQARNPVPLMPVDGTGNVLPSYVRIGTDALATWQLEGNTASGPWSVPLQPRVSYDLLIIPPATHAPLRLSQTAEKLASPIRLDPGHALTVTTTDDGGRPLSGVRTLWSVGALPSTLGTSDDSGQAMVRLSSTEGPWSAVFNPSPASGRLTARVGDVDVSTVNGVIVRWSARGSAAVTVTVTRDGGAPVSGARVHLETVGEVPGVATVTIAGAADRAASGTFTQDVASANTGVATFAAVPSGSYQLSVFPDPALGSGLATKTVALTVGANKATTATVSLPARRTYAGKLGPASRCQGSDPTTSCQGMRVVAYAAAEVVPPSGTVDASGSFQLALDPALTYDLVVQPAPGQLAPQIPLGTLGPTSTSTATYLVPEPVALGVSLRLGGRAVPSAAVRVYCVSGSPKCTNPDLPLAEGQSDDTGQVLIGLPAAL